LANQKNRPVALLRQKVEFRFEKSEAVRFISHHDLLRALQRAVRRAGLPARWTEGFNPRPRLILPAALEVGVASLDEVAELELIECLPLTEVQNRLEHCLPPGLILRAVTEIPPTRKGGKLARLRFKLHLAEQGIPVTPQALAALSSAPRLILQRPKRPGVAARQVDLRPNLATAALDAAGDLVLDLAPSPQGLPRPLESLSLLTQTPVDQLRHIRVTKLATRLEPPPNLPPNPAPNTLLAPSPAP
jgi:radical SAM-linked protein